MQPQLQLLIVAPESELDTRNEILNAVGPDTAKVLHGPISVQTVLDHIKSGEYTGVHFAGHGTQMRLNFTDGSLDAALLGDAIRKNGRMIMCLFNSCDSIGAAMESHRAGSSYAIAWQDEVSDKVAITFAFAFWASYKMHNNVADAYRTGREAVIFGHPDNRNLPFMFNGQNRAAQERLTQLTADAVKSQRLSWGIIGLLSLALALAIDIIIHLL